MDNHVVDWPCDPSEACAHTSSFIPFCHPVQLFCGWSWWHAKWLPLNLDTMTIKGKFGGKWISHKFRVCGVEGRGKSLSGRFFFVCEKDDREKSSTKSLGGMMRPKDEMGSQMVSSKSDISHPIPVYLSRNNNSQAQARRLPALTASEPELPVISGSKWDPLTSAWRQGGASPERLAELPTGVSPLQKRIW